MAYGAILRKGEEYFTNMRKLFDAIGDDLQEYNWLITDCECYPKNQSIHSLLTEKEYCWLDGKEFKNLVESEDFQWVWSVFSGFDKRISLSSILKYPLPYANGYIGFWKEPISIQNSLASVEIVPWDSSLILFISNKKQLVDKFMNAFPQSEELSRYNKKKCEEFNE